MMPETPTPTYSAARAAALAFTPDQVQAAVRTLGLDPLKVMRMTLSREAVTITYHERDPRLGAWQIVTREYRVEQ